MPMVDRKYLGIFYLTVIICAGRQAYILFKDKRLIDIILSLLGLIILSPLFLIVAIAIKIDSPALPFKTKRVGIYKQHFNILKFRSMTKDAPIDIPPSFENWISGVPSWASFKKQALIIAQSSTFSRETWHCRTQAGPGTSMTLSQNETSTEPMTSVGLTGWAQINGRDEPTLNSKQD